MDKFVRFFPILVCLSLVSILIYVIQQQHLRFSANDPQIEYSENIAKKLAHGEEIAAVLPATGTDIATSLSPFYAVYDLQGHVISSTAILDGKIPEIPKGVFDYTNEHMQDRITWQPQLHVRQAIVVTKFSGIKNGYAVVGRSLREVEKQEQLLLYQIALGWVSMSSVTFIFYLLSHAKPKKK